MEGVAVTWVGVRSDDARDLKWVSKQKTVFETFCSFKHRRVTVSQVCVYVLSTLCKTLTLTVMYVFWLIDLWTGFAWTVSMNSFQSLLRSLCLHVLTYCLFVCVVYTGKYDVLYDEETIYLDGYWWRKKKWNGYLIWKEENGRATHPIFAHMRYVPGTFPEH